MDESKKIPVTVVTGFLGAGKTTFINHILSENPEIQFALVENEFGDVSIDTKLIKGLDASQMFEMRQGCICCTITDEYELVLQELAERFPNVGHLLIETTGVADPAPVIRPFFTDDKLKGIYRFNGTVCLADAIHFDNYPDSEISLKQIAIADSILVSKSEKSDDKQKNVFRDKIQKLNPLGEIHFSSYGNTADFNLNKNFQQKKFYLKFENHTHDLLDTKTLKFEIPLEMEDFKSRFSYMLDVNKTNIYRAKGIISFVNEPYEYILQGVGGSFELSEGENLKSSDSSEIVLIGRISGADLTM